jgi:hypothetical protein
VTKARGNLKDLANPLTSPFGEPYPKALQMRLSPPWDIEKV